MKEPAFRVPGLPAAAWFAAGAGASALLLITTGASTQSAPPAPSSPTPPAAAPAPRPHDVRSLYRMIKPSVVVIRTEQREPDLEVEKGFTTAEDLGSGVLIGAEGQILTAAHLVQVAEKIQVEFSDGSKSEARVLASNQSGDVALLQARKAPRGIQPAKLGDSDQVEVGDRILIVGAPDELSYSLSVGYISARRAPRRDPGTFTRMELLQTDAAVNPGNSGGPMVNEAGEVVGIISHNRSDTGGSQGLGFAVTTNFARRVLIDNHAVWLGFEGRYLDGKVAELLNIPQTGGLLVEKVARRSFADRLGLRAGWMILEPDDEDSPVVGGDVLLSVDGVSFADGPRAMDALERAGSKTRTGAEVRFTVLRAGKVLKVAGRLPAGPAEPSCPGWPDPAHPRLLRRTDP